MRRQRDDYWLEAGELPLNHLAQEVFRRVLRTDFRQPGFAILAFPQSLSSRALRETMVALKGELSRLFFDQWGERLEYLSMGRFNQQTTTKLHLDGAPERSLLMLGYEPSAVASDFLIADYSACARELGLTPAEFLDQHNPMFASGEKLLRPCLTTVSQWSENTPRIVVINNSSVPPGHPKHTAGVLHGATIPNPDPAQSRVINSTMIVVQQPHCQESAATIREFVESEKIAGPL